MGEHNVQRLDDEGSLRRFSRQLINDVRALEHMLAEGAFETGVRRIGAEQELFLVDERGHPASIVEQVLDYNDDSDVVTELTRFNLEFNMDPQVFEGDCLRRIEEAIKDKLDYVRGIVRKAGGEVAMVGILPTIHISDVTLENMTPMPRYYALNDALQRLRGGPAQFQIRGTDELYVKHDSIMLEGCNTSFQTHFQVAPDEFARLYNIAQVIAAPVLAAAVNSPILFGKRLWRETRIALFQQAVDTRSSNLYLREMSPRVHFGTDWVKESVTEIFKEDISRFRVLLTTGDIEDPFEAMAEGRPPSLKALLLHNGTVYRWNRACYGVTNGKPHLRIENRILPSGPTPVDEVANAAFWFGLVSGLAQEYEDITEVMDFDDAKSNFIAAARLGLAAQLNWLEGMRKPAPHLILDNLLPLARRGLLGAGIDQDDADRYLGIIEARVSSGRTGSDWQVVSLANMRKGTRSDRLDALVKAMVSRQIEGNPVHTWELAELAEGLSIRRVRTSRVEHYMTTDLFTVHEDELVEFVACLMDWQRLRHVLVEDEQHRLVGLVSHRSVLRYLSEHGPSSDGDGLAVRDIMVRDPISVSPEMLSMDAIKMMRDQKIGALPVVRDDHLVGLVTERDFLHIAGQIIDETMEDEADA
jgi:CBS domain-containing protein